MAIKTPITPEEYLRTSFDGPDCEYVAWGVSHIWLVDPCQRKLSHYGPKGLTAVSVLDVPELGLTVSAPDLFD